MRRAPLMPPASTNLASPIATMDQEREAVDRDADRAFEGDSTLERRLQSRRQLKAQNRERHAEAQNYRESNS